MLALDVELVLEERGVDRVRVTLVVSPADGVVAVEGASLQLVREGGEVVCPRLLVPIRGELHSAMATTLELRGTGPLPPGCRVQAVAWCADGNVSVSCPADPFITPGEHVRGQRVLDVPADDALLTPLDASERAALNRRLPWLRPAPAEAAGVIEVDDGPSVDELQEDLGLDAEQAAWLKDLLDEPDP